MTGNYSGEHPNPTPARCVFCRDFQQATGAGDTITIYIEREFERPLGQEHTRRQTQLGNMTMADGNLWHGILQRIGN
jgi:hypothetical protein